VEEVVGGGLVRMERFPIGGEPLEGVLDEAPIDAERGRDRERRGFRVAWALWQEISARG
jgi:hypothetical protein